MAKLGLSSLKCTINNVQKNNNKRAKPAGVRLVATGRRADSRETQKQKKLTDATAELAKVLFK